MAGQPKIEVNLDSLVDLIETGTSKTDVAKHFNICRPTLDRIIRDHGLTDRCEWSNILDEEIDELLIMAMTTLPSIGERMARGYLRSKKVKIPHSRLREAIRRVDLDGLNE